MFEQVTEFSKLIGISNIHEKMYVILQQQYKTNYIIILYILYTFKIAINKL